MRINDLIQLILPKGFVNLLLKRYDYDHSLFPLFVLDVIELASSTYRPFCSELVRPVTSSDAIPLVASSTFTFCPNPELCFRPRSIVRLAIVVRSRFTVGQPVRPSSLDRSPGRSKKLSDATKTNTEQTTV